MIIEDILIALLFGAVGYLAVSNHKKSKEIDALFDFVAKLAESHAELAENDKKLEEAEKTAEERIAAQMEKRWNDGLQKMLDFNPYLAFGDQGAESEGS